MYYLLSKIGGNTCNMFNRFLSYRLIAEENYKKYKQMEEWYLKLRQDYFALQAKLDKFNYERMEQLEETIEKLIRELNYKSDLLTKYHLYYGQEILDKFHKKVSKSRNNDDVGELER